MECLKIIGGAKQEFEGLNHRIDGWYPQLFHLVLKSAIQQKPPFLHFVILSDIFNGATWCQNSANKTTITQQLKSIEIFFKMDR